MSWNYRVVRNRHDLLSVQEVHYGSEGEIMAWYKFFENPLGGFLDLDELRAELDIIAEALDRPILSVNDLIYS